MIEIIVCHKFNVPLDDRGFHTEYVGRPSILGNPFTIGKDGDRAKVIELYEDWLRKCIINRSGQQHESLLHLASSIERQGGIILSCWCAPLACHGDVIAKVLREEYL